MKLLTLKTNSRSQSAATHPVMDKKSFGFMSFYNFLTAQGLDNLAAYQAIKYATQVSPLADAIDTISTEAVSTKLYVLDDKKGEFNLDHPLLTLLKNPNSDVPYMEFMSAIYGYYLITGNAFIMATGAVNKPALELFVIPPQFITLTSGKDGYTDIISYNAMNSSQSVQFERKMIDGRFRYISTSGLVEREMWQIRRFNPNMLYATNWGMSPMTQLYFEIEQYIKASIHNLAQLTNGARPSGAFFLKDGADISQDQLDTLQEQANRFYQGPENSGKLMFLNAEVGFTQLSINNKDMDFELLKKDLTLKIYNRYKVPAPLVTESAMTYNNFESSKLALYDFAVLPLMRRILSELTLFLMPRYEKEPTLELSYNEDSIPALALRRNETLKLRKELGIFSMNEMRAMVGFEEATGGDAVFGPISSTGVAFVGDNILENEESDYDLTQEEEEIVKFYINEVKNQYRKTKKIELTDSELAVKKICFIRALVHERSTTSD